MTQFLIHEVTHHGDFRKERDVVLPDLSPATVSRMMQEAAYQYSVSEDRAARVAANLERDKRADHGWTTWVVKQFPACWKNRTLVDGFANGRVLSHDEECDDIPTAVVLVPMYPMTPLPGEIPLPEYWPVLVCDGHAPELMHELLSEGHERDDLITTTIDRKETDDAKG